MPASEELGTWRLQCGQGPACSQDSELYLRGWALKPASPGQSLPPAPLLHPSPHSPPSPPPAVGFSESLFLWKRDDVITAGLLGLLWDLSE